MRDKRMKCELSDVIVMGFDCKKYFVILIELEWSFTVNFMKVVIEWNGSEYGIWNFISGTKLKMKLIIEVLKVILHKK